MRILKRVDFAAKFDYNFLMDYDIVYSARKTIAIKVSNGKVTVCAPLDGKRGKYDRLIHELLEQKRGWIEKKVREQTEHIRSLLPGLIDFSKFYLNGSEATIELIGGKHIIVHEQTIEMPRSCTESRELFCAALKMAYRAHAAKMLKPELDAIAERIGVRYTAFGVSDASTRWGCCNDRGRILLSWRLIILRKELREYVMIHELCHRKHLDHSPRFWSTVEQFCPNYRQLLAELNTYVFLNNYLKVIPTQ